MKVIFLFLLSLILGCSKNSIKANIQKSDNKHIDTITYSYKGYAQGIRLDLLSDGSFVNENFFYASDGWGRKKIAYGTFKIDDVNLILTPIDIEYIEYSEDDIEPIVSKLKYGIDSLKIKTEYQIVTWENNKYLLSDNYDPFWSLEKENDYIMFANYLNSGLEPKRSGRYLANKVQDSVSSIFDLNQIPLKWREYFLDKPIKAKIKEVRKVVLNDKNFGDYEIWIAVLDKGYKDKINTRLSFKNKKGEILIGIDSVLANSSFGRIIHIDSVSEEVLINSELRTKWE